MIAHLTSSELYDLTILLSSFIIVWCKFLYMTLNVCPTAMRQPGREKEPNMAIEKWQPFGRVHDFDYIFNRFHGGRSVATTGPRSWSIPLDVVQDGDELVVTASVPGATNDEIDVSIDDNVLTIKAESSASTQSEDNGYLLRERRTGSYYRALRLPETVDYENAKSTFKDGVLTIKLPKLESKKAKKLEVSAA